MAPIRPRARIEGVGQGDAANDRDDVEHCRGRGRHAEHESRVQHPHHRGGQRDEEDEGEEDAGELNRQLELSRHVMETEVGDLYDERRAGDGHNAQDPHQEDHGGQDQICQFPGRPLSIVLPGAGEEGGEGNRQRPLGEHVAQQIGDAEGRDIDVQQLAGAEHGGEHHLAHQAEQARCDDGDTDDPRRPSCAGLLDHRAHGALV